MKLLTKPLRAPHKKTSFRTERNTGEHNDCHHRLKMGNGGKYGAAGHGYGAHHGQYHYFPCLRTAMLKAQEKGRQGQQNDNQTGQIVFAVGFCAEIHGQRHQYQ